MNLIDKAPRGALIALAVIVCSCAIAACGSSSSTSTAVASASSSTGSSSTGGSFAARRAALVACLKSHGVTLPARPAGGYAPPAGPGTSTAGGAGPRGFFSNNPQAQAAFRACGANFGFRGGGARRRRISPQAIQSYVTCVRQHGYNLPNPNLSGTGPVFPASIRSNPKFQAASRVCQNLLVPSSGGPTSSSNA